MKILVMGAAGTGTSTLSRALASAPGVTLQELDDLYWLPGPEPYTEKRSPQERLALLKDVMERHRKLVVAGSPVGWGRDVEDAFDLIVFLYAPVELRLARIQQREEARFGRIRPAFLAWASQYDEGAQEGRSLARHVEWLKHRRCPVLRLMSTGPVEDMVFRVKERCRRL